MEIDNITKSFIDIITEQCLYPEAKIQSDYVFDGRVVPRVTNILARTIHDDYLLDWANSLGFKRKSYRKVLGKSADLGTDVHEYISFYLNNGKYPSKELCNEAENCIDSFDYWWEKINTEYKSVEVLESEKTLGCPYFGGTFDALISLDNKVTLIDFKTSNRITFKYLLQLAAYRYLIWFNNRIDIDQCLILRLSKNGTDYEELIVDLSIEKDREFMNFAHQMFFSLVTSYNYIINMEQRFREFYKGKRIL